MIREKMKTFKSFLSEAYSFFPETVAEIESGLASDWSAEAIAELVSVLDYFKKEHPRVDAPINVDKTKSKINVSRQLQDEVDLARIKSELGLSKISMKFGNGSSGNRGANNRGNAFEGQWAEAMEKWWAGEPVEGDIGESVRDVVSEYNLDETKQLSINVVGGENTRRPLNFSSSGIYLENPKGTGFDVGPSVTDITLKTEDQTI